jgi:hypothetical protein
MLTSNHVHLLILCAVMTRLGFSAIHRKAVQADDSNALRDPSSAYAGHFDHEMAPLRTENTRHWDVNVGASYA